VFGAVRASSGNATTEYRFTGQQEDATLGLTYLRARYYDPSTGRFLTKDPWRGSPRVPASQHRYAYVQNGPTNAADPSGLCAPLCLAAAAPVLVVGAPAVVVIGGVAIVGLVGYEAYQNWDTITAWAEYAGDAADELRERLWGPQYAVVNWPPHLPGSGSKRYIPPKSTHGKAERNHQGEYVDQWGNRYRWDPVKGEWEVQHRDGSHTNVGVDGEITHGDDNFPNKHPDEAP
jgi:RHS repeat-associated protein